MTSLAHTPFVMMLRHFAEHGETQNERDMARLALDLYGASCEHPTVIAYVDHYALKVLS